MKIKNLFSMLAMAGMLFATSCSQDEAISGGASAGDFVDATFTIGTADGMGTRAIGDGTTVDKVACTVYDADGKEMDLYQIVDITNKTATYSVRLAKGQNYRVAFFAYNEAADAYDVTDLKNIEVKAGQNCNAEGRDAFTAYYDVTTGETMNAFEKTITLYRPFAQLNLGIDAQELEDAEKAGIVVAKSKIVVSNVYNVFSAYDDAVAATDAAEEMVFELADVPTETLKADANNDGTDEEYTYLALNYILVGDKNTEKALTDIEFIWETENGKTNNPTTTFINIPVQRNYRTNILGRLLTNPATFNIVIDEKFEKPDYIVDENENTINYVNVSTFAELQAAVNAAKKGANVIKFVNDIDAEGNALSVVQKEGVDIVIDGCDKAYTNGTITVNGDGRAGGAEKLTFKDINFDASSATSDFTFINAPSKIGSKYNYSHNVTIEGCDFTGNYPTKEVGSASFTGTYNFTMKNCTATKMHSMLQIQSCDNKVFVDNVTVKEGKNGVSFGNTAEPTLINSTIEVAGYGVRADGDASRGNLVVKDTKITAQFPIAVRKMKTNSYAVALQSGVNLTAGQEYEVVFTANKDEDVLEAPTGTFSITGAESFNVYPAAAGEPKVANTADKLTALLADASVAEILLGEGAVIEGAFKVNRPVAIKSVSATNKATIKGRVDISGDASFENVKFDINSASEVKNVFTGANYKYPSTANIYAAAATFEGCEFVTDLASGVCGINYGSHGAGKMLKVNNCTFKGDLYAIRSRTLFSITNCDFDVYTTAGTLAAVFTWGNGTAGTQDDSGANSVTFTNNSNMNVNKVYGVQLASTTFNYCNIAINVQDNTDFIQLSESVNPACDFTGCTFATGSETF